MNIALINQWYPPLYGGVATYNYYMAQALAQLGHRAFIVAKAFNGYQDSSGHGLVSIQEVEHEDGLAYYAQRLPMIGSRVKPTTDLIYSRKVYKTLHALSARSGIDIAEYAEVNCEGYFHATSRRRTIPVVARCHTPTFLLERYYGREGFRYDVRWVKELEKRFVLNADAVTAPSRHLADQICAEYDLPKERVAVIPNPIDVDEFKPDPEATRSDEFNILFVGRLDRGKGIWALAKAMLSVFRQRPEARLTVIGSDRNDAEGKSSRAELTKFFHALGFADRVACLGEVNQETLVDNYRRAHVCVAPSLIYESFSYTCVQAMAAAKPVIASRIGGIPEVVDDGVHGILIGPGEIEALTRAILHLAENPPLREQMGQAARAKVSREYSGPKVAEKAVQLYAECRMIRHSTAGIRRSNG